MFSVATAVDVIAEADIEDKPILGKETIAASGLISFS